MPRWRQTDRVLKHAVTRIHSRCGRKPHRLGLAGVQRQGRRDRGVSKKISDHRPLGHTLVPVQRVRRNLAAVPHFFQLRLFVRPASLPLHVDVYVHGVFSSFRGGTEKGSGRWVRIQKLFWPPPFFRKYAQIFHSASQRVRQIPPWRGFGTGAKGKWDSPVS